MAPGHKPPKVVDVSELIELLPRFSGAVIALDGCLGAGKSTLMRKLARRQNWGSVDVDDYVIRGQRRYVAALRLTDLDAAIRHSLESSEVIVLAGVCMRAVLGKLGRSAAFNVYVQRDAPLGPPYDYAVLAHEDDLSVANVEPEEANVNETTALFREVCRYHTKYRPRLKSDAVYAWVDQEIHT